MSAALPHTATASIAPATPSLRIATHAQETLRIAAPIAVALLGEMAMGLISTMMLGGLGADALAAGGLATNLFFTLLIVLQGVLSGAGVLAAHAIGADRAAAIKPAAGLPALAPLYWSGMALAAAMALPFFLVLSFPMGLLTWFDEPAPLAHNIARYLLVLRWAVPGGLVGVGMMRQFLPAIGLQNLLLWVMPGGVAFQASATFLLMHGAFAWRGYGMLGAAAANVLTLTLVPAILLALLHGRRRSRASVAPAWPQAAMLKTLLAIGLPIGATVAVEAALFAVAGVLAGRLGPAPLAAHMIALSVASTAFMVPLALSQAANVRVALAAGGGDLASARRAGLVAIGLGAVFMSAMALLFAFAPGPIVALYIGGAAGGAAAPIATHLLRIAGVFQIFDGTQCTASGALRGVKDTRVPMLIATFGYWGVGFPAGWALAFRGGLGVQGLWWGLCAGLACVALGLTVRFAGMGLNAPRE